MKLTHFLIVFAVIHVIVCIVIYLCVRFRILKFSEQLMPIIVLVPVAGIGVAVIADYYSRTHKAGTRDLTLEDMHLDYEDLRLQQLIPDDNGNVVIPLEEAMSVNDAKTRRMLMLDILHQNPEQYTELLHRACMDDDIEVSHYASTAIMELQREYEYALQKSEKEYSDHPDDPVILDRYINNLKKYISSGLIDENILFVYRNRYADVLKKKMEDQPQDMQSCLSAVDNYMELEKYTEALNLIDTAISRWPSNEAPWLAKLKVLECLNDGGGIREIISQIKKRKVYLSQQGKNVIAFWDRSEETEVG